jgi:hypothetical protein
MPRMHIKRRAVCAHGERGSSSAISRSRLPAAHKQGVDAAAIVVECPLSAGLLKMHGRQPLQVGVRPVALGAVEAHVVAEQQLGESVACAHEVAAEVFAGADQVAQRFFFDGRHRHRVQLAGDQQPHQALGVALIGLDAIARPARNTSRRAHHDLDSCGLEAPSQREPRGPGFICRPHRTRQARRERRHFVAAARKPLAANFAGPEIQDSSHRPRHVHIERDPGLSLHRSAPP